MRWAWKIARIAGIDVRIHVTFLALLAWVGWSRYAAEHSLAAALGGIAFILVVFGIVVLHELGHALAARHYGISTRDITLLPIGGVAALERMPENPRHELVVALAGPAVNVVLAIVFALVLAATGQPFTPTELTSPTGSLIAQLLWLNVGLFVFNSIPAFPMDGGRALRALLAMRLGDLRATQLAATLGQAFALLLGFVGLFGNPLLMFIALFVWLGATGEARAAQLKYALHGVPVEAAMIRTFGVLAPSDPLSTAVELMLAGFQHDFPVVDSGTVVGVLTRENLLRALARTDTATPVRAAMDREFAVAHPGDMLDKLFEKLQASDCKTVPVLWANGSLVGLVTLDTVAELLMVTSALDGPRRSTGTRIDPFAPRTRSAA